MRRPDTTARRVLAAYAEAGRGARLHTAIRWATCPFPAVEALIPERGRILDLGCGHGHFSMYMALKSPDRDVLGVDIDAHKIEVGTRVVHRAGLESRVELMAIGDGWDPTVESFDAVVANDVLYLMGRHRAEAVLAGMAAAVNADGVVVVKEMGLTPRWKHQFNEVQERIATKVLRITAGSELEVLTPQQIEEPLAAAGLRLDRRELHRGYLHPHLAVVGTRRK